MTFTNYTIVPVDEVVNIDGFSAHGVDMGGIPSDIHSITWNGLSGLGTIEYKANALTGILPPPQFFTDPEIYLTQVNEAQAIIEAANNPITYYSTIDNNVYEGTVYRQGAAIVIYTPNTPQPSNTTTEVPPTGVFPPFVPSVTHQDLYWYNNAWVVSSVDPSLSLANAKAYLTKKVRISGAEKAALQAGIHSILTLVTSSDPGNLLTADYAPLTLSDYQNYLDGEISLKLAVITGATQVSDLYNFDPNVDPNP